MVPRGRHAAAFRGATHFMRGAKYLRAPAVQEGVEHAAAVTDGD